MSPDMSATFVAHEGFIFRVSLSTALRGCTEALSGPTRQREAIHAVADVCAHSEIR